MGAPKSQGLGFVEPLEPPIAAPLGTANRQEKATHFLPTGYNT